MYRKVDGPLHGKEGEVTICSAFLRNDEFFIDLNLELITRLNGDYGWKWILLDNHTGIPTQTSFKGDHRYVIMEGIADEELRMKGGNYHHAGALNKAIGYVDTRFVLFLDPDFYVVRPKWILDVVSYMKSNNLSFFGAPWHPKYYRKWRYFPCQHFFMIDLSRVTAEQLDFTPETSEGRDSPTLGHLVFGNRWNIGTQREAGFRIFHRFGSDRSHNHECLLPVYRMKRIHTYKPLDILRELVWQLSPERFHFAPKKTEFYSQVGFKEAGYSSLTDRGWEEFMWRDSPFGFHMRRNARAKHRDFDCERKELLKLIAEYR